MTLALVVMVDKRWTWFWPLRMHQESSLRSVCWVSAHHSEPAQQVTDLRAARQSASAARKNGKKAIPGTHFWRHGPKVDA